MSTILEILSKSMHTDTEMPTTGIYWLPSAIIGESRKAKEAPARPVLSAEAQKFLAEIRSKAKARPTPASRALADMIRDGVKHTKAVR